MRYHVIFLLSVCLSVCADLTGCGRKETSRQTFDSELLRDGDLLLRCGYGIESSAVSMASGSSYSHIGIACHDSARGWMVVHAVPGESGPEGIDRLKYEPVDSFFSVKRTRNGAVARVLCDDDARRVAVEYAVGKYRDGVLFDHDYVLEDSVEMYCAELVWRSFRAAGVPLVSSPSRRNPLGRKGMVIYPSDFLCDTLVSEIVSF